LAPLTHILALAGLAAAALVLVRTPRALFTAAGGARPSRRLETVLLAGLFAVGAVLFESGLGSNVGERWMLALIGSTLCAVAYADMRFLIIPDLYSLVIAAAALVGPLAGPLRHAGLGALVCGGLLASVAFAFRKVRGVEGLGFGDVKLAAALGGLLGPVSGMWVIALASIGGVLAAPLAARLHPRDEVAGQTVVPLGACLAVAAAALLLWARR
jgi:leader peptidase (prepilin peptidase)/N-methyltransferase